MNISVEIDYVISQYLLESSLYVYLGNSALDRNHLFLRRYQRITDGYNRWMKEQVFFITVSFERAVSFENLNTQNFTA